MSPETDNTEAKASKMAIWYRFNATSEIFIVKWLDNKCVITWQSSATDKRNEEQSQWHFTCFRSEKWSWSLFMRIIYVITNAWIIHKFVNKDKKQFINVLDFKKDICLAYLKPSSERPSGVRKDGTPKPSAFQDDIRIDMGRHSNGKKNDVALPCEATLRKTTNPWSSLFIFTKNTCWESPERPCEDAQMQCIHKMTLIFAQWSIHKLAYVCRRCFPSVWFIGQSVFSFLMLIKDVLVLHFDFQVL